MKGNYLSSLSLSEIVKLDLCPPSIRNTLLLLQNLWCVVIRYTLNNIFETYKVYSLWFLNVLWSFIVLFFKTETILPEKNVIWSSAVIVFKKWNFITFGNLRPTRQHVCFYLFQMCLRKWLGCRRTIYFLLQWTPWSVARTARVSQLLHNKSKQRAAVIGRGHTSPFLLWSLLQRSKNQSFFTYTYCLKSFNYYY